MSLCLSAAASALPKPAKPEKLNKVRALFGIMPVELLRTDVFNDRLKFFKARSGANWLRQFRSPQMRGGRSRDDSIAHRHRENFFDSRDVQIARDEAELITGQPQIDVRRLNFRDLSKPAGGPVRFDAANDERLSLNRFRLLMLDCLPSSDRRARRA